MLDNEVLKPLPDIIAPKLRILFVGTNPGRRSSQIGHYFAGRGNVFWVMLHKSGLIPHLLTTKQDRSLLKHKYGLTDVIKRPSRSISGIRKADGLGASDMLDRTIRKASPEIVAFLGKTGYRYYVGNHTIPLKYGLQENTYNYKTFLLPSTSGASYADTKPHEKLFWFKKLKELADSIN